MLTIISNYRNLYVTVFLFSFFLLLYLSINLGIVTTLCQWAPANSVTQPKVGMLSKFIFFFVYQFCMKKSMSEEPEVGGKKEGKRLLIETVRW